MPLLYAAMGPINHYYLVINSLRGLFLIIIIYITIRVFIIITEMTPLVRQWSYRLNILSPHHYDIVVTVRVSYDANQSMAMQISHHYVAREPEVVPEVEVDSD